LVVFEHGVFSEMPFLAETGNNNVPSGPFALAQNDLPFLLQWVFIFLIFVEVNDG